MRILDAGTVGIVSQNNDSGWNTIPLKPLWGEIISLLVPDTKPRPVQTAALDQFRILENRRNLIISSPTNSGKSLLGTLVLLEAIQRKQRAVLLEPLRALAQEKADELKALQANISSILGHSFEVRISTGDYRLEHEDFSSPPSKKGELIVATPERLEAIIRNPDYDDWLSSIGAVCADEAHLISSSKRGPTLEYLITFLLSRPAPPRIALLSGTLGNADKARDWLTPCDVIQDTNRQPPLQKFVVELLPDEDANEAIIELTRDALNDTEANMLLFVYQTKSTTHLAKLLNQSLENQFGSKVAEAYHAQMNSLKRASIRKAFEIGECRCLVATTALGSGVNLPATHVIIRDTTFPGSGILDVTELSQMIGRAGRGNRAGKATVILRQNDGWKAQELVEALQREDFPELVSHFEQRARQSGWREPDTAELLDPISAQIAALLSRMPDSGMSLDDIASFFQHSLGNKYQTNQLQDGLAWLTDPMRVLAYRNEQQNYLLTVLGLKTTRSVLPFQLSSGFAQLIRDILTIDPRDLLLSQWTPLDHLIALNLLYDRVPALRRFSSKLVDQVDAWVERHPNDTPLLYREWIVGQPESSRAEEILGSLGLLQFNTGKKPEGEAFKKTYLAVAHAIVLFERGQGMTTQDLERQWQIKNLEGVEERWRDDFLWLLSGLTHILDLRCFYYHLREECSADFDRVKHVKRILRKMRNQAFELQEHIKYCSPLGPVLRGIRYSSVYNQGSKVGIQTIRRIEEAGITSIAELAQLETEQLIEIGVRRDLAKQIRTYLRRRLQ